MFYAVALILFTLVGMREKYYTLCIFIKNSSNPTTQNIQFYPKISSWRSVLVLDCVCIWHKTGDKWNNNSYASWHFATVHSFYKMEV